VILRVTPLALEDGAAGDDAAGFAGAAAVGAAKQYDAAVNKQRRVVTIKSKLLIFREAVS